MKEFFKNHLGKLACFGSTLALAAGKIGLGWTIGWVWVFAPLWIPVAIALSIMGMLMIVFGMVIVALFGMVGIATYMDFDFLSKLETKLDEAEAEVETPEPETAVEPEAPVEGESETLQ